MMLLTKAILKKLPPLYAMEHTKAENVPVVVKFFCPWGSWSWYATEFDGKDLFFGLVDGHEKEVGYFRLSELKSLRGPWGLRIERDMHFGKHTLAEVMEKRL